MTASEPTPALNPTASAPAAAPSAAPAAAPAHDGGHAHWFYLSLAALGVVYGDIGTSPLYALRECFHGVHSVPPSEENVLGVLSLVFWALIIVVTVKYLVFILRADNKGEGGILALTALATPIRVIGKSDRWWLVVFGIFGGALLYGDGMITPAISVLSAVEGLNVATHVFEPYVLPITLVILVGLFWIQSHGTEGIGILFGPVMIAWFVTLAVLGIGGLLQHPGVLISFNPWYGYQFLLHSGLQGFLVLGSVVLVVTGGEALYADMGHFGRRPIRIAWFGLVLPALMLNYLGQGSLLIRHPDSAENPFYELAPDWALYPLVVLSTLSAVIASQALISGAYSITMQASQLGFLPRLLIKHTSKTHIGQIYMPTVNWALMLGCLAIVVGFKSSNALAAAYGIAVTATMVLTTVIFYVVTREKWKWPIWQSAAITGFFLAIDLAFLAANSIKIPDGGWFPLLVAVLMFTIMTTWKRGRYILSKRMMARIYPVQDFLKDLEQKPPVRVPGTAIFMSGSGEGVPPALVQNLQHNKVVHERVVLLTVKTQMNPHVPDAQRTEVEELAGNIFRVVINYGFMEDPDLPRALALIGHPRLKLDPAQVTYFLGRESVFASDRQGGMALWRERLFALMSRNATSPTNYFCLPPSRVVEMGSQVEI